MPMKISLALGPRQPLSRQTAWGCLTANLALPGSGSLVAGRAIGYAQLVAAILAFVVSLVACAGAIVWFAGNWTRIMNPEDPLAMMGEIWKAVRWSVLGIGLFLFSMLWAL